MEIFPELAKGTGSRTQVLMWNGRDARGLNFAQEVNKREMGLPGGVAISRALWQ